MKTRLLVGILLVSIFMGISIFNAQAQPKTKYYILFDNFEDQLANDGQTTITNLIDLCYWDPMQTDVIFGPYCERAKFGAATFNKRDITEYDVAVFPMGMTLGLETSVDGIKVIDKILQMIDAGKSVMIIGNAVLYNAFKQGGDPKVLNFLQEFLGIDYIGRLAFTDGSTIWGATIDGKEGDPVAKGFDKVINQGYNLNNEGFRYPIRYYPSIDVFKMRTGTKAKPFDQVTVVYNDSLDTQKDVFYTGVRGENGTAKVALWTTNFDIANTWHTLHYNEALMGGIEWATNEIPRPEKYIFAENMQINFGKVEPGSKGYKAIAFQNFGRTPLKISKTEVADFEGEGVFTIVEGGGERTLEPLEIHYLNVEFKPLNPKTYTDGIDIKSDATNGTLTIEMYGVGGDQVEHGPKIQITDLPINYGTVPYTMYSDKNLGITNVGDIDLVVDKIQFVEDANKFFSFPQIMKVPVTIKPGTTYYFVARFTPLDSNGGSYTGKIIIESNGLNNQGKGEFNLVAKGAPKSANSGITLSNSAIEFGKVMVGDSAIFNLGISNTGVTDLSIFQVKLEGGGESKAQYSFVDGTDVIPTLKTGESHTLKMKFKPSAAKTYELKLKLASNDPVSGNLLIPISGIGDVDASVEDPLADMLNLTVKPNPISGRGLITYDYNGTPGKNIRLSIIDVNGNIAAELYNGQVISGMHIINVESSMIAAGKYSVVAEMDGMVTQVPLVIVK